MSDRDNREVHAVCLLGCEQQVTDIQEPCDKPTVAVSCERAQDDGVLVYWPHRMCDGHAKMHEKDPGMLVTQTGSFH